MLFCKRAYGGLFQLTYGKQSTGNGGFWHCMQEVTLIFIAIQAFQQARANIAIALANMPFTNIVPGGDFVGSEHFSVLKEDLKFDLPVTQNIRVGRAARFVFG